MKKPYYFLIFAIILIIGFVLVRKRFQSEKVRNENPYQYDVGSLKEVDSALYCYKELKGIKLDINDPYAIAVGNDKSLYVAGDEKIFKYASDGKLITTINLDGSAHCIAFDTDDNMYLGFNRHIEVFSKSGERTQTWDQVSEVSLLTSIAIEKEHVFVADAGNKVVFRYNTSGQLIDTLARKDTTKNIRGCIIPSRYFDVAVDPDKNLWIVNPGRHSLENYTLEGDLRSYWGKASMKIDGFCGCCNPVHIAILENGNFVTSEKGLTRIKLYNPAGELVCVIAGPEQFEFDNKGVEIAVDNDRTVYALDPHRKEIRIFKEDCNG